jgi:hypothetical protein
MNIKPINKKKNILICKKCLSYMLYDMVSIFKIPLFICIMYLISLGIILFYALSQSTTYDIRSGCPLNNNHCTSIDKMLCYEEDMTACHILAFILMIIIIMPSFGFIIAFSDYIGNIYQKAKQEIDHIYA